MKKVAAVILLSAVFVSPALADNTGKGYLSADVGSATYSNIGGWPNPSIFRVAGGLHFNPNFAGEIGYTFFGDSTITGPGGNATLSARSFQVAAVGSLPVSPQFDLIGKLGFASNSYTATGNIPGLGGGFTASSSQTDLLLGLGAQFHVNSQLSVQAQYLNYGKFESVTSPMKATSVSVGVVYDF